MTAHKSMSVLMRIFYLIKCESIAWSLRRLWCPVSAGDLVLEVGSGANPYFRSNVLLDAYEETRERHWEPLIKDRPTILGFVEKLPFADKSFDFVIASHVLEHSSNPELFLKEIQRVAKAGYIEVPDAFMERINPYHDHRLEVTIRKNQLIIRKKSDWLNDPELVELYEDKAKKVLTQETMQKHPFHFHSRFYWENEIKYEIVNNEVNAGWIPIPNDNTKIANASLKSAVKKLLLSLARITFSQTKRNSAIDIKKLLICPECKNDNLGYSQIDIVCTKCNKKYVIQNNMPVMISDG